MILVFFEWSVVKSQLCKPTQAQRLDQLYSDKKGVGCQNSSYILNYTYSELC